MRPASRPAAGVRVAFDEMPAGGTAAPWAGIGGVRSAPGLSGASSAGSLPIVWKFVLREPPLAGREKAW